MRLRIDGVTMPALLLGGLLLAGAAYGQAGPASGGSAQGGPAPGRLAQSQSAPGQGGAAKPAVLRQASVQITSGNDGKDALTTLTVSFADASGTLLGRAVARGKDFKPGATVTLPLRRIHALARDQLDGSRITFRIDPHDDERWVVQDAVLRLTYDGGASEAWHWGPFELDATGSQPFAVVFALTDDHRQ